MVKGLMDSFDQGLFQKSLDLVRTERSKVGMVGIIIWKQKDTDTAFHSYLEFEIF